MCLTGCVELGVLNWVYCIGCVGDDDGDIWMVMVMGMVMVI